MHARKRHSAQAVRNVGLLGRRMIGMLALMPRMSCGALQSCFLHAQHAHDMSVE